MSTKASLLAITPMVPAGANLPETLHFFAEELGFTIVWQTDSMAGISRDLINLNLVQNDLRVWADNASFSFAVSDLEALYEEYARVSAQVGALEMKPWGRREFHMILPTGVCFQFYERSTTAA